MPRTIIRCYDCRREIPAKETKQKVALKIGPMYICAGCRKKSQDELKSQMEKEAKWTYGHLRDIDR